MGDSQNREDVLPYQACVLQVFSVLNQIIQIHVYIADTELDNGDIAINIMGTLTEQEHDITFADVLAKPIMDDYQHLKPWVKEGIVHRIDRDNESRKVASRSLEVKYRMHDEFYPEVDEMGYHDIDEEGIANSLLRYIKSLHEIYSRIYPTSNHKSLYW